MDVLVYLTPILLFLFAGVCTGVMDQLQFKVLTINDVPHPLVGKQFWDVKLSWRNKWKNGDPDQGERFLFSSSLLVWLTDGWHLFKMLQWLLLEVGFVVFIGITMKQPFLLIFVYPTLTLPRRAGFILGYNSSTFFAMWQKIHSLYLAAYSKYPLYIGILWALLGAGILFAVLLPLAEAAQTAAATAIASAAVVFMMWRFAQYIKKSRDESDTLNHP